MMVLRPREQNEMIGAEVEYGNRRGRKCISRPPRQRRCGVSRWTPPRGFEVVQEVHNQRSVHLLQLQLRRRKFDAAAGVFDQKPEGMRIGVASVGAGAPFDG
jgi:hypothetical protein